MEFSFKQRLMTIGIFLIPNWFLLELIGLFLGTNRILKVGIGSKKVIISKLKLGKLSEKENHFSIAQYTR